MKKKGSHYIIIPADVRYDKRLPNGAKLLYGDICGLTNKFGYCFATNGYFAEMFSCTDITVSNWISKLKKCGYIDVSYNPHRRIFVEEAKIKGKKGYRKRH